ncbi:MAG: sugar transferase [Patescibacteria group bacterium]
MKRSELIFTFLKIPVDLLMVVFSFVIAYWLRTFLTFVPTIYIEPLQGYLHFILTTIPIWLVTFIVAGLYSVREKDRRLEELGKIIVAVSSAVGIVLAWIFLSRTFFFSRLIIIYVWLVAIILVTLGRFLINFIERFLYRYDIGVHRVIVVGGNSSTRFIVDEIKRNRGLGYKLVKVIDEAGVEKLEAILERNPADEIIVTNTHLNQSKISEILEFCRFHQISLKTTPDLFLVRSSHIDVQTLAGVPIMEFKRTSLDGWGRIIKRIVDLVGSLILIIIFSPLMLIIAGLIKLTSRGPILFRQERVGLEKKFIFYKFRSMKNMAEKEHEKYIQKYGNMFKLSHDPRATPLGRILRKTSLDELPQFFNVLKGDMSLIGPRPPLPSEVERYTTWQRKRLGVKPGITGLWQVSGRSELSFDEWVRLDAYYIENWSLWLDLQIFLRTLWVIIRGRGAY